MVAMTPGGDGLLGGINHNIAVRCLEDWPCVLANHLGPVEDIHDGSELHPPWTRDSLDPILESGGDAQVH
jgi:hypothetical protein